MIKKELDIEISVRLNNLYNSIDYRFFNKVFKYILKNKILKIQDS